MSHLWENSCIYHKLDHIQPVKAIYKIITELQCTFL